MSAATGAIAAILLSGLAVLLAAGIARAGELKVDDPEALARTRSLGRVIEETRDRPVHLLFVHGMRAEGPGFSHPFMKGLCRYAPVKCDATGGFKPVDHQIIDLGAWPQRARVMNRPVWISNQAWLDSRPFVDRYVFPRDGAPPVIVDELNWWPLLFPLKCRFLVAPDAQLTGLDKAHLELCRRAGAWLTEDEVQKAKKGPFISGGGAVANAALKQQIMNWGLADAVITLGPMRDLLRLTVEKAFDYAAGYDGRGVAAQEFVMISESLGSFMIMDAAGNPPTGDAKAKKVVSCTSNFYFFANQFALLELGRISDLRIRRPDASLATPAPAEVSPFDALSAWAEPGAALTGECPPKLKQIIAFSDPSDALTYDVPKLGDDKAIVVNIYDRNEFDWFGLFAWPITAHTGHGRNDKVLRQMFKP